MSKEEEIVWDEVLETYPESVHLDLKNIEIGQSLTVQFIEVKQTGSRIVAVIDCPDAPGDHLWLKGDYGPQNGLRSLVKAANGGENIEGNTFVYTKVESEKSPAGYAHFWSQN